MGPATAILIWAEAGAAANAKPSARPAVVNRIMGHLPSNRSGLRLSPVVRTGGPHPPGLDTKIHKKSPGEQGYRPRHQAAGNHPGRLRKPYWRAICRNRVA